MKLKRIKKNALYSLAYGCSVKKFMKIVRSSPDGNIKRIPARKLKQLILNAKIFLEAGR